MFDINLPFKSDIDYKGSLNRESDESFEHMINYINPIHFIG